MAKSSEPDMKSFRRTFIIALVFLSFMAVLIIYRKTQSEKLNPPVEAMPY